MGKIKIYTTISMDGFLPPPDGNIGWILKNTKENKNNYGYHDFLKTIGRVLFDFKHYADLAAYGLRGSYGNLPCLIICSESPAEHNLHSPQAEDSRYTDLKVLADHLHSKENDAWLAGSPQLISNALEMGIVEEITSIVLPVSLTEGTPLLINHKGFKLLHSQEYPDNTIRMQYSAI